MSRVLYGSQFEFNGGISMCWIATSHGNGVHDGLVGAIKQALLRFLMMAMGLSLKTVEDVVQ